MYRGINRASISSDIPHTFKKAISVGRREDTPICDAIPPNISVNIASASGQRSTFIDAS